MINRMPAGDVCIELNDEGQAKISGGVAEFEIPALNASDYPSLPVTGADNTMTVKCGMLREMIEKTIYAVSQDDKKPAHTGEPVSYTHLRIRQSGSYGPSHGGGQ